MIFPWNSKLPAYLRVSVWSLRWRRLLIAVAALRGRWAIVLRPRALLVFIAETQEASHPTGSSLAGVSTAVVEVLHILHGILDILTCLGDEVIRNKKGEEDWCVLVVGLTPKGASER
jgi:hypothetical protein